jgi:hypothetical protein
VEIVGEMWIFKEEMSQADGHISKLFFNCLHLKSPKNRNFALPFQEIWALGPVCLIGYLNYNNEIRKGN